MLYCKRIENFPIKSNCFVLFDRAVGDNCIIIDPGSEDNTHLFQYLDQEGLLPEYIILTHEHFDHIWGVNTLVDRYGVPVVCSQLCAEAIKYEKRNCSVFYDFFERFTILSEAISIESINAELPFFKYVIRFFKTPGHTDASICFVADKFLFTGDTLIKDEKTVTKLPTGSVDKLKETVKGLEGFKGFGYEVCPGHGEMFEMDEYDLNRCS